MVVEQYDEAKHFLMTFCDKRWSLHWLMKLIKCQVLWLCQRLQWSVHSVLLSFSLISVF